MQCLFSIDHCLHPCNACFSLTIAYTHAMLVLHWPLLTPMQCLFFIDHCLHPCNACSPLTIAYTHAMLVFHWPLLTPMQCLFSISHGVHSCNFYAWAITLTNFCFSGSHFADFIYDRMYLSTSSARFIAGQGNVLQRFTFRTIVMVGGISVIHCTNANPIYQPLCSGRIWHKVSF